MSLSALCCLFLLAPAEPTLQVRDGGLLEALSWGTPPVIGSLGLRLPKPGWNGMLFSSDSLAGKLQQAADGKSWTVSGTQAWDGGSVDLAESVAVVGSDVRVSYRLKFHGRVEGEGLKLCLTTPVDGMAGQGASLTGVAALAMAKPLPATLPDSYRLFNSGEPAWFGWQLGDRVVRLVPQGNWLEALAVQDDRQFQSPWFEAQLNCGAQSKLVDGGELEIAFTLSSTTVAELAAEGIRRVEAMDMWDVARTAVTSRGEAELGPVTWSAQQGPKWQPVELKFSAGGTWDNPFDPAQVDLNAVITMPDGKTLSQPAFYYQGYEPLAKTGPELLAPSGQPEWRVRWTPPQEGRYAAVIRGRIGGQTVERAAGEFVCQGASGHGFVRRQPNTPYYLQFDDGSPYLAIGENICWDRDTPVKSYRDWFEKLGQAGGNYCRIWLVRWNLALEWMPTDPNHRGAYDGLGKYSLDNAWRLDQVLQAAADNGIYCMLCLGYHGELLDTKAYFGENCWQYSPYNQANGGPCAKPAEFWTNETAQRFYQRRLRYTLARWGCHPNVMSWEFWNEVKAPAPWVNLMGTYVKDHDLHQHLRTTTYGDDDVWKLPVMDYTQTHHYGSDGNEVDGAPLIANESYRFTEQYGKPFQMGEFGIDWKSGDNKWDPKGIGTNLHNGMWSSIASRSLGTAAIWYWDGYVDPLNQYPQFTSIANFAKLVDWRGFKPQRPQDLKLVYITPQPPKYEPVVALPASHWARQPEQEVTLKPDGEFAGGQPMGFLFSPGKPNEHSPLKLRLDMPAAGKLTLTVGQVSVNSKLVIRIDGEVALTREFPCGPEGEGRYESTKFSEQYQIWQSVFNEDVSFDVPAGEHHVELSNEAGDWMTIPKLVVTGYRDASLPNVAARLLVSERQVIGWLCDRASNWQADYHGETLAELPPLRLTFSGLQPGSYTLVWFDTWAGQVLKQQPVTATADGLTIETPAFRRDLALVVR